MIKASYSKRTNGRSITRLRGFAPFSHSELENIKGLISTYVTIVP